MIKSMTGYGRGEYIKGDRQAIVEISAVNNRYLDTSIRMPRSIMYLEEDIRQYTKRHISRGKLDIYITYNSQDEDDISISINENICKKYIETLRQVQDKYNLIDDISTTNIIELPDVLSVEKNVADKDLTWEIISGALEKAVANLNDMRSSEGRILKEDLNLKGRNILKIIDNINERSPLIVDRYKQKLYKKILETLDSLEQDVDDSRILTEVAIFSDRTSIDEELTRLRSHITQFNNIINEGGVIGRKLDFLLQEINRESNTIGSKASDELTTKYVIELKSEIEKIREQVQNIE